MGENVNVDKALWHRNHGWTFADVEKRLACMTVMPNFFFSFFFSFLNSTVYIQPNEKSLKCDNLSTNGITGTHLKPLLGFSQQAMK